MLVAAPRVELGSRAYGAHDLPFVLAADPILRPPRTCGQEWGTVGTGRLYYRRSATTRMLGKSRRAPIRQVMALETTAPR